MYRIPFYSLEKKSEQNVYIKKKQAFFWQWHTTIFPKYKNKHPFLQVIVIIIIYPVRLKLNIISPW